MAPIQNDKDELVFYGPPYEDHPLNQNMAFSLLEKMAEHDEGTAQIEASSGIAQTFAEVRQRSIRVAMEMTARGLVVGDTISICGRNHLDLCLPLLAGIYLGVTVNPVHGTFSRSELTRILGITQPKFLFCDAICEQLILAIFAELELTTEMVVFEKDFEPFLAEHEGEEEFVPTEINVEEAIAFILCTSGTTGPVKGVSITQQRFWAGLIRTSVQFVTVDDCPGENEFGEKLNLTKGDNIMLVYSPLSWITAIWCLVFGTFNGSTRVVAEYEATKNLEYLNKYNVTWALYLPIKLTETIRHPLFQQYNIAERLKLVLFGGMRATHSQIDEFRRALPNSFLYNAYGTSEMSALHCMYMGAKDLELYKEKVYSGGKLLPGHEAKVVDPETNETLGPNQPGELWIKGVSLTIGYYNDPEATRDAINEDGFFHTGDIVYFDEDDCLYVVGRSKEILKYRGFQIAPVEVEAALMAHPAVMIACVVGKPSELDGDLVTAFVIKKPGHDDVTEDELIEFVDGIVSDAQKIRGGIQFVTSLPFTASGKFRRNELMKLLT